MKDKEPDWIIHAVTSKANPGYVDYHTHGLTELYGHTEISIYSDLDSRFCTEVLNMTGANIRNGLKIRENEQSWIKFYADEDPMDIFICVGEDFEGLPILRIIILEDIEIVSAPPLH